jgi:uncharacterized membrane protein YgcG
LFANLLKKLLDSGENHFYVWRKLEIRRLKKWRSAKFAETIIICLLKLSRRAIATSLIVLNARFIALRRFAPIAAARLSVTASKRTQIIIAALIALVKRVLKAWTITSGGKKGRHWKMPENKTKKEKRQEADSSGSGQKGATQQGNKRQEGGGQTGSSGGASKGGGQPGGGKTGGQGGS